MRLNASFNKFEVSKVIYCQHTNVFCTYFVYTHPSKQTLNIAHLLNLLTEHTKNCLTSLKNPLHISLKYCLPLPSLLIWTLILPVNECHPQPPHHHPGTIPPFFFHLSSSLYSLIFSTLAQTVVSMHPRSHSPSSMIHPTSWPPPFGVMNEIQTLGIRLKFFTNSTTKKCACCLTRSCYL